MASTSLLSGTCRRRSAYPHCVCAVVGMVGWECMPFSLFSSCGYVEYLPDGAYRASLFFVEVFAHGSVVGVNYPVCLPLKWQMGHEGAVRAWVTCQG